MTALTHEQLLMTSLIVYPDGVVAVDRTNPDRQAAAQCGQLVFSLDAVHPAFFNLLSASSMMYATLSSVQDVLTELTSLAEDERNEPLAHHLLQLASSVQLARVAATEGIASLAKRSPKY